MAGFRPRLQANLSAASQFRRGRFLSGSKRPLKGFAETLIQVSVARYGLTTQELQCALFRRAAQHLEAPAGVGCRDGTGGDVIDPTSQCQIAAGQARRNRRMRLQVFQLR